MATYQPYRAGGPAHCSVCDQIGHNKLWHNDNPRRRNRHPGPRPRKPPPPPKPARPTPEERFWRYVDKSGDCWIWTGNRSAADYGRFYADGQQIYAHRYAYELTNGPIPPGLDICHHCDTPPCVRPAHLFAGTAKENTHDAIRKGRMQPWLHAHQSRKGKWLRRITEEQLRALYAERDAGVSLQKLALKYGYTEGTIKALVKPKTRKIALSTE